MQSERSYLKKKKNPKHKKQNKGRSDLFVLVAGFILTYSNPSVSRQQRGTLSDISGADTKSACTLQGRRVTREQQQLYKNNTTSYSKSLTETMVQWRVGTKVTSDPPALQIQPTPNLLFSEQTDSSLFPFTAVCSFTVWRSSYKGRQHGPASSHTHTDTQRPLC